MTKEKLIEFLKQHLSIEVCKRSDYYTESIEIRLKIDGEVISSDSFDVDISDRHY